MITMNHDNGTCWYNSNYLPMLEKAGLVECGVWRETTLLRRGGTQLRRLEDRGNYKLELDNQGKPCTLYVKIHRGETVYWPMFGARSFSPGEKEWRNAWALLDESLPCYTPIAAGHAGELSFFASEDLYGAKQLDYFFRDETLSRKEKAALIEKLARLVRQFHHAGFCHKDLYLCHFFCRRSDGDFDLNFIDLQRVERFTLVPDRWIVKDLAALNYSARMIQARWLDCWRFLRVYFEDAPGAMRSLLFSIRWKTERIRRHDEKTKRQNPRQEIQDQR